MFIAKHFPLLEKAVMGNIHKISMDFLWIK